MQKIHSVALSLEHDIIDKLAKIRKEKAISYQKLAEKTGLHRTAISLIERKERHPTLLVIIKLARALGIELKDLV